ncbi:MAG TPA: hypothetical protein PK718_03165 [Candidatus Methanofastidiosa archaeon]|nr:hypothetical protein [Candidatus Methanofastidiosa archaeon]
MRRKYYEFRNSTDKHMLDVQYIVTQIINKLDSSILCIKENPIGIDSENAIFTFNTAKKLAEDFWGIYHGNLLCNMPRWDFNNKETTAYYKYLIMQDLLSADFNKLLGLIECMHDTFKVLGKHELCEQLEDECNNVLMQCGSTISIYLGRFSDFSDVEKEEINKALYISNDSPHIRSALKNMSPSESGALEERDYCHSLGETYALIEGLLKRIAGKNETYKNLLKECDHMKKMDVRIYNFIEKHHPFPQDVRHTLEGKNIDIDITKKEARMFFVSGCAIYNYLQEYYKDYLSTST